jgi:hypothetical protein
MLYVVVSDCCAMSRVLYEHSILRCDALGLSFLVVGHGSVYSGEANRYKELSYMLKLWWKV